MFILNNSYLFQVSKYTFIFVLTLNENQHHLGSLRFSCCFASAFFFIICIFFSALIIFILGAALDRDVLERFEDTLGTFDIVGFTGEVGRLPNLSNIIQ